MCLYPQLTHLPNDLTAVLYKVKQSKHMQVWSGEDRHFATIYSLCGASKVLLFFPAVRCTTNRNFPRVFRSPDTRWKCTSNFYCLVLLSQHARQLYASSLDFIQSLNFFLHWQEYNRDALRLGSRYANVERYSPTLQPFYSAWGIYNFYCYFIWWTFIWQIIA